MMKLKIAIGVIAGLMAVNPVAAAEYEGVVAHIVAKPGQRDALIEALRPLTGMKGLIDLVIAKDRENADAVWLTEVWESSELHKAASTGAVFTAAMEKIRPAMASIDQNYTTTPVFGNRLK